jgi:hypothetical protein
VTACQLVAVKADFLVVMDTLIGKTFSHQLERVKRNLNTHQSAGRRKVRCLTAHCTVEVLVSPADRLIGGELAIQITSGTSTGLSQPKDVGW